MAPALCLTIAADITLPVDVPLLNFSRIPDSQMRTSLFSGFNVKNQGEDVTLVALEDAERVLPDVALLMMLAGYKSAENPANPGKKHQRTQGLVPARGQC